MTTIIAELGINHNGSLDTLIKMANAAKKAGADFVKIQKRTIDWCYTPMEMDKPCKSIWGDTIGDKVKGRELSWESIDKFVAYCEFHDISWFSSCFDMRSLEILNERYNVKYNKVPSALTCREKFLKKIASYRIPTLISTGLCGSYSEIEKIGWLFEDAGCPFIFNHCVALYPAPVERLNLSIIKHMKVALPTDQWSFFLGVGYSGHEVGILPSVIAASMGAKWIERHFTLDRAMYGADQAASMEPQGFERMVRDIRLLDKIEGFPAKSLQGDEKNPVTFWREYD